MLDYTKYLKESYRFILNYEVIDGNIIVHYSKEEDNVIPYSKDAEKMILILMKNQIEASAQRFLELEKKYANFDDFFIKCLGGTSLAYSVINQQILAALVAFGFLGFSIFERKNHEKLGVLLDDYDKNKFFVDNIDRFIEFGLNITINDLDKYSKSDLVSMLYKEENYALKK